MVVAARVSVEVVHVVEAVEAVEVDPVLNGKQLLDV